MRRVSVVGSSGSGKSTVAKRLAAALEVPYVELDHLHWGPSWSAATADELRERVTAATAADAWVIDGNYQSKIGTVVWERADTVVWVNPSRSRVTWQVVTRTVRRAASRQALWNGNRETWRGLLFWRGEESILWWAWTTYAPVQARYAAAMAAADGDPRWSRLRSRKDVERLLASLPAARR